MTINICVEKLFILLNSLNFLKNLNIIFRRMSFIFLLKIFKLFKTTKQLFVISHSKNKPHSKIIKVIQINSNLIN